MEEKDVDPFVGLAIGRIVHVWTVLMDSERTLVRRPAIVTEVKNVEYGIISAHIFKSPDDPPGEVIRTGMHEPLGVEIDYAPLEEGMSAMFGTWHWPERSA